MSWDTTVIERLVREVLQQLQQPAPAATPAAPVASARVPEPALTSAAPASVPTVAKQSAPSEIVQVDSKIITAATLEERVKQGAQVRFLPQAIITPAAQDVLRKLNIRWDRAAAGEKGITASAAQADWLILLQGITGAAASAVDAVRRSVTCAKEWSGTPDEAATRSMTVLSRSEFSGLLVLTSAPQRVACRANRQAAVRAVEVRELKDWKQLTDSLQPNLICLNPEHRSFQELKNLMQQIVTSPAPVAPDGWN